MNGIQSRVAALKKNLEAALEIEQRLARELANQADALLARGPSTVIEASRALDEVYHELRSTSDSCRSAMAQIEDELGSEPGAPLRAIIDNLPTELRGQLEAPREALKSARVNTRRQSARNAAMARAQLDAMATVRGIVGRACEESSNTPSSHSPLSRLDAKV